MCKGVHCGPHYRNGKGKSHYIYARTIYHNQCELHMKRDAGSQENEKLIPKDYVAIK